MMEIIAIIGVAGMMFAMGLTLSLADFRRIVQVPWPVMVGLFGQIILLPMVAITLAYIARVPDYIALGLVIIAACPGGATSNAFSFLAKGDVALSVTLTAISAVIAFFTVPLVIGVGIGLFGGQAVDVSLPFMKTASRVFLTTALPVMAGIMLKARVENLANNLQRPIFWLALVAILVPSVAIMFQMPEMMNLATAKAASIGALLNVVMLACGFLLARLAGLSIAHRKTISIEVGIQNFGLVLVVVYSFLGDPRLLLPGLFYLTSMLMAGGALALFFGRSSAQAS